MHVQLISIEPGSGSCDSGDKTQHLYAVSSTNLQYFRVSAELSLSQFDRSRDVGCAPGVFVGWQALRPAAFFFTRRATTTIKHTKQRPFRFELKTKS